MQSHAGQKRFQLFVEKREKCKKIFLLLPTLLQAGTKGGERALAKALLYCRQKRFHLEGSAKLNVRDLAFKIAEARVMAFVSWHWIRMFVHFSTINVIVRSIFFHHDFHVLLILLLSILVHCLCMKTHKRWRHWHSLPRADQLWSPNGEKNISSGVVFTIYSIFSSSLFTSTFVIFPPIFFSGWRRVQPEALRSGSSARKPS